MPVPRSSLLLLLSPWLLVACSTAGPEASYASDRFDLGAVPAPAPVYGDHGPPRGQAGVRFGGGRSTMDIRRVEKGSTGAGRFGLGFELVPDTVGGGVQLSFEGSDDDLFGNDPGVDTSVAGFDLFPHFTFRPHGPRFRVPLRVGTYLSAHGFEVSESGFRENIDWYSFGLRFEVEPEYDLVRRERDTGVSLYGRLRLSAGGAGVNVETVAVDDDFRTDALGFGFETGLRFQIRRFLLELGYTYDSTSYAESDFRGGNFVRETGFRYSGLFMGFGMRW